MGVFKELQQILTNGIWMASETVFKKITRTDGESERKMNAFKGKDELKRMEEEKDPIEREKLFKSLLERRQVARLERVKLARKTHLMWCLFAFLVYFFGWSIAFDNIMKGKSVKCGEVNDDCDDPDIKVPVHPSWTFVDSM